MDLNLSHKEIDSLFWRIALQDDEDAFKKLFNNFFAPLCIYARHYLEHRNVCEDVVQDVFLNIWKNRKSLNIRTSTRNFLVTSVKNSCIDYLRKKEVEARYTTYSGQNDPYEEILYMTSELEDILQRALSALPDKAREIFELSRFEGLTYAEIAEKKQISVKTVEAYMTKSLKHLRVELKDYLPFILLFLYQA